MMRAAVAGAIGSLHRSRHARTEPGESFGQGLILRPSKLPVGPEAAVQE
jgi:hypothetical protein